MAVNKKFNVLLISCISGFLINCGGGGSSDPTTTKPTCDAGKSCDNPPTSGDAVGNGSGDTDIPTSGDASGSDSGDTGTPKTTRVFFLNHHISENTDLPSDCRDVTQQLDDLSSPALSLGTSVDRSLLDFASKWVTKQGAFVGSNGQTLHVTPTESVDVSLSHIDIPTDDWNKNKSLDQRDLSSATQLASCNVATKAQYSSDEWHISIDNHLQPQWISSRATDNQADYDREESDRLKKLFGDLGLGYGTYLKGGVFVNYNARGFLNNIIVMQTYLLWRLVPSDTDRLSNELLPRALQTTEATGGSPFCQPIWIRFSNDANFEQASPRYINRWNDCEQNLPLIQHSANNIPDPQTDEDAFLQRVLPDGTATGNIPLDIALITLNDDDSVADCDRYLGLYNEGSCQQLVIHGITPHIIPFLKGEKDLYIEIELLEQGPKTFVLNRESGAASELPRDTLKVDFSH